MLRWVECFDLLKITNMSSPLSNPKSDTVNFKNMIVAVRIRPLSPREQLNHQSCCAVINDHVVSIKKDGLIGRYLKSEQGRYE